MVHSKSSSTSSAPVVRKNATLVSIGYGACVLLVLVGLFVGLIWRMPQLSVQQKAVLFHQLPPKNVEGIRALRDVFLEYAASNPVLSAVALSSLYVLMQTFAIPGTLSLSILSGALFGLKVGFTLVAFVSTLGSSCCYLLSWCLGKPLVYAIWPEKVESFSREVTSRRKQMLNYMLFLRVTPVLPNTFINVASPIVGVPLHSFALGTFLGCLPNNFVAVNAGVRLSELNSLKDLFDPRLLVLGITVGIVALLPIFLTKRQANVEGEHPHAE